MKSVMRNFSFVAVLFLLVGLLLTVPVYAQEVKGTEDTGTVKAEKNPVARLRGRLLYKRGQIRKLEKAATESSETLKDKVDSLEKERRAQYVAAEPKLVELYAEQDALEEEIKRMTEEAKAK